jgi:hypothetical protein
MRLGEVQVVWAVAVPGRPHSTYTKRRPDAPRVRFGGQYK